MTFNLEAFRRGVDAARASIEDANDYTLMIHGMAAAMHESGRDVEPRDLSCRWHDPLCDARAEDVADPAVKRHGWMSMLERMVGIAGSTAKAAADPMKQGFEVRTLRERDGYRNLGLWRFNHLDSAVRLLSDEVAIARDVVNLFDVEYKEAFPGKRRGTKHYKELLAKNEAKARALVLDDLIRKAEREMRSVKDWMADDREGGFVRAEKAVLGTVKSYADVAADVEALVGGVPCVWALRTAALEIEALWRAHEKSVVARVSEAEARIAEAKRILGKEAA